jgi:hypothetical protein
MAVLILEGFGWWYLLSLFLGRRHMAVGQSKELAQRTYSVADGDESTN